MVFQKNITLSKLFILLSIFLSGQIFSEDRGHVKIVEQPNSNMLSVISDEDKLLEEAYQAFDRLYQKVVELTALYYCGGATILHDRIVMELGKDAILTVKSLALYIPVLLKNSKISKKTKLKKCIYAAGGIIALLLLIKEGYQGYYCSNTGLRQHMMGNGYNVLSGQGYYGAPYDYYSNSPYNIPSPIRPRPPVPGLKPDR